MGKLVCPMNHCPVTGEARPSVYPMLVLTLCSLRPRFCCCSMRSEADAGGDAALMLRITLMLSSGSGGRPSISRFSAFMLCSSSKPPRVHCNRNPQKLHLDSRMPWHTGLMPQTPPLTPSLKPFQCHQEKVRINQSQKHQAWPVTS